MARFDLLAFLLEHWGPSPPLTVADLTGKTVLVVGANAGLGLEASKLLAKMNPGRLILACRSAARGEAALKELQQKTGYHGAELWLIDLGRFASVKAFADRFEKEGGRLDILVSNAGIYDTAYTTTVDGWESVLQVNYLSHCLLSLLLLPRMVQTAKSYGTRPRLVAVSSLIHFFGKLEEGVIHGGSILRTLGSKEYCSPSVMFRRYQDTKLLNLLFVRALNDRLAGSAQSVVVNAVNPGVCHSGLLKDMKGKKAILGRPFQWIFSRTTEEGARKLLYAVVGQPENDDELRGAYITNSQVAEPGDVALDWTGMIAQKKIWDEMVALLKDIDSRVQDTVTYYLTEAKTPALVQTIQQPRPWHSAIYLYLTLLLGSVFFLQYGFWISRILQLPAPAMQHVSIPGVFLPFFST